MSARARRDERRRSNFFDVSNGGQRRVPIVKLPNGLRQENYIQHKGLFQKTIRI